MLNLEATFTSRYQPKILAVDDDEISLELIRQQFLNTHYQLFTATSGHQALAILRNQPESFDLVLLDKNMDEISGLEVLRQIKVDPVLKILPVVMESAENHPDKILECIRAGAYYFLTKPFDEHQLLMVVENALNQHQAIRTFQLELSDYKDSLHLIDNLSLSFRTLEEVRTVSRFIKHLVPLSACQEMGLIELMLNAVEHGNLEISYDEKTELICNGQLYEEINRRLALPKYQPKTATLNFQRKIDNVKLNIIDQGGGFEWEPFLEMQIERVQDNHGRGIAMAKNLAFDSLEYLGSGNQVEVTIILNK